LLLVLASSFFLGSESRGTRDHILLSQIRDSPNLEGQVPVFIFPRIRVAQLYPQALGSLFEASYDSQGYGGGIRTRLHAGWTGLLLASPYIFSVRTTAQKTSVALQWIYSNHIENTSCDADSIVTCAYFGRCLTLSLHITICILHIIWYFT
jgi:hypothetical protein